MIIWINGSFGVGKTETAHSLASLLLGSYVYDPEQVGAFLWDNFPPAMQRQGDFQDIPLWREFNVKMILYLYEKHNGDIIIPMTLVKRQYFDEIIVRLKMEGVKLIHCILTAPKEIITARLLERGDPRDSWAHSQIDRCLHAFERDIPGIKIDTLNRSAKAVAEVIREIAAGTP